MNFAEAARMNAAFTRTENGAVALSTTGDARLDFFGTVGSVRGRVPSGHAVCRAESGGGDGEDHRLRKIRGYCGCLSKSSGGCKSSLLLT